jgi:hypothetical protein
MKVRALVKLGAEGSRAFALMFWSISSPFAKREGGAGAGAVWGSVGMFASVRWWEKKFWAFFLVKEVFDWSEEDCARNWEGTGM